MSNQPDVIAGVTLTHPDKVLYPGQDLTKRDLANYYEAVADWMLPHVANRPISLVRCPNGEGKPCFFQRHSGQENAKYVRHVKVAGAKEPFLAIDDVQGLIALAQLGTLEIHVWGAKADKPELPDRIVFDFDPDEELPFAKVKAAAREMRQHLKDLELESFVKVTGGKGLHVVAPITRKPKWPAVKNFTRDLASAMANDSPGLYTINARKTERKGKIYIDYLRNDKTASAVAVYSTRARKGAPIAAPITWDELGKLKNAHSFTLDVKERRCARLKKDPWAGIDKIRQSLPTKV